MRVAVISILFLFFCRANGLIIGSKPSTHDMRLTSMKRSSVELPPANESNNDINIQRRNFMRNIFATNIASMLVICNPTETKADLNSVPLIGRFEKLTGANAFIGKWSYEATKGVERGILVFLKNGEVELRSEDGEVIAVGAVPWKYVSPKGTDTIVTLTFTLDEYDQDDVLIFQGKLDSAGGP
ncbi:hypothetical protein CTEN210_10594 [Chaetoceros tenuissimus]|uniref:Uncharacterized protein n=1 Tax=Chaetoceros tenuissimus TaxID=426638 RepID=A0AAD3CXZ2_9STRA|nr:hypothetical protein CTEN210_10594 [Chaetoceros tenuissimus]